MCVLGKKLTGLREGNLFKRHVVCLKRLTSTSCFAPQGYLLQNDCRDGDLCGNMLIQIIQFFSSTTNSFTWGALIVIGVIGKLNDALYKKSGLIIQQQQKSFSFSRNTRLFAMKHRLLTRFMRKSAMPRMFSTFHTTLACSESALVCCQCYAYKRILSTG